MGAMDAQLSHTSSRLVSPTRLMMRLYVSMLIDFPPRSLERSLPSLTAFFPKVVSAMPVSLQWRSMSAMMASIVIMNANMMGKRPFVNGQ